MAPRRDVGQAAKHLGWTDSPGFIGAGDFTALPQNELRYACRKAVESTSLQGVYLLHDKEGRNHIPLAFLCEAKTEAEAREIHRRVWNLNLVPFVVVESPSRVRVYQGFHFDGESKQDTAFAEASLSDATEVLEKLAAFHAEAIDDGRVFEAWGQLVTPKSRVDTHLLDQLQKLDGLLRKAGLARDPAHCLIGKYVWLSYLRARGILSPWRMQKYGVSAEDVFSRDAKLTAFHHLDDQLQNWLNGEIFPLKGEDRRAVKSEHLQLVAGVFSGDDADGQLCLFDQYYDFSHIPIETLSVVYEQFLHHKEQGDESSEGEESGAYYTPLCLADFMIAEMDRKVPLRDGVAVFDPSCGSGVFLVQAYRRLVERTMQERGSTLGLRELRSLLVDNIFGVDRDPDACRVARMSLAIALLDYADAPDVSGPSASFKLPTLSENNIKQHDFFLLDPSWPRAKDKQPPQWIIGNPPWVELKTSKKATDKRNAPAWKWLDENNARKKEALPVSGNQVAEMFVWRVMDFARDDSVIGLVMPAMTLFKHEGKRFRQGFFGSTGVWCVANFANFMEVLFAGRARQPAATFFYRPKPLDGEDSVIATYSPFVAEQRANLPVTFGKQLDTWNILIRSHEIREIDSAEAAKGDRLTWKLAMWGSERERKLLRKLNQMEALEQVAKARNISISEGPQIKSDAEGEYPHDPNLIGLRKVQLAPLKRAAHVFVLPAQCFSGPLEHNDCYVRRAGGIDVCMGPHLLVDVSRRFAIYESEPFLIPSRQIGVHAADSTILKALALYLLSPVFRWQQIMVSSQWGVSHSIATLADLKIAPIPAYLFEQSTSFALASIYDQLSDESALWGDTQNRLLAHAETILSDLLRLNSSQSDLIQGFFGGVYQSNQGKLPADATRPAAIEDITRYCLTLRRELDDYTTLSGYKHRITATMDARQVCLTIDGADSKTPFEPVIVEANKTQSESLRHIARTVKRKHSQWMYFEKALHIYEKGKLHFIKPRRRIEWNVRQAVLDADDIIADSLTENE